MTSSRQIRAACAKGSREEKTKQPKRIYPSFSFFLRGIRKKSLLTGRKVICVGGRHSLPCAAVLVGNDWPGVQKTLTNTQQAFLLVPRVLERPRPPSMNTKKSQIASTQLFHSGVLASQFLRNGREKKTDGI